MRARTTDRGMSYALVTAAYNEATLIETTLRSVTAQTIPPQAWVIVSDGSTDQTQEIAESYAARFPFIQVIRIDRDPGRSFVSKLYAVREGFKRIVGLPVEFVGNLDADVSFEATYFENLLKKFRADPQLGVGGGWIMEEVDGVFLERQFNSSQWVPHAVQLLRRICYETVGDYVPLPYGGEDTWAVVSARMQGWNAESFPDLPVRHHRKTNSAGGLLRSRFRTGLLDHSLGYHPAYELMKCGRRASERPFVLGSAAGLVGFAAGYLRRLPRPVSREFVEYVRREQRQRLKDLFWGRASGQRASLSSASLVRENGISGATMKLSVVVICWNDLKVVKDCLESIYNETAAITFEVIVSDNGSTDTSVAYIREHFPEVRIVENGGNLGFARGNNAGIDLTRGEYVLILNPDTIIRDRALEKLVTYADGRPDGGAFGCRVLNPDGSFQNPARPLPTLSGALISALNVRWLGRLSAAFESDIYYDWAGETERAVGLQSGCCVMVRRDLLERLRGFDERFFYHYEETDLCRRIWASGSRVLFYPGAEITHLGGQSVGRFPIRFALETYRSRYRYFYKHFGRSGVIQVRWLSLLDLGIRHIGYSLQRAFRTSEALDNRMKMYRVLLAWNWRVDPIEFIGAGAEPDVGYAPLAPAPSMVE